MARMINYAHRAKEHLTIVAVEFQRFAIVFGTNLILFYCLSELASHVQCDVVFGEIGDSHFEQIQADRASNLLVFEVAGLEADFAEGVSAGQV